MDFWGVCVWSCGWWHGKGVWLWAFGDRCVIHRWGYVDLFADFAWKRGREMVNLRVKIKLNAEPLEVLGDVSVFGS